MPLAASLSVTECLRLPLAGYVAECLSQYLWDMPGCTSLLSLLLAAWLTECVSLPFRLHPVGSEWLALTAHLAGSDLLPFRVRLDGSECVLVQYLWENRQKTKECKHNANEMQVLDKVTNSEEIKNPAPPQDEEEVPLCALAAMLALCHTHYWLPSTLCHSHALTAISTYCLTH